MDDPGFGGRKPKRGGRGKKRVTGLGGRHVRAPARVRGHAPVGARGTACQQLLRRASRVRRSKELMKTRRAKYLHADSVAVCRVRPEHGACFRFRPAMHPSSILFSRSSPTSRSIVESSRHAPSVESASRVDRVPAWGLPCVGVWHCTAVGKGSVGTKRNESSHSGLRFMMSLGLCVMTSRLGHILLLAPLLFPLISSAASARDHDPGDWSVLWVANVSGLDPTLAPLWPFK